MRKTHTGVKGCAAWIVTFILTIALVTPALAAKPSKGVGVSHKAIQTPPIQLGTSGGWRNDLANGYCCGGTLGSLVEDVSGTQYILSNFHVFAGDTSSGDNDLVAETGDFIIQPGLIDVSCRADYAQNVANLSQWADPLVPPRNAPNIDAAIAQILPNMVEHRKTSILEIGTISSTTRSPSLNLSVKKSGRTTGLTRSKITGLDATIYVTYDDECAGVNRGTATFTNQIVINNRGSKFLAAGDSGSLMVEDVSTYPRAVGLLFAGSSSVAIANPIGDIVERFKVTMVGVSTTTGAVATDAEIEKAKKVQAQHAARLKQVPGSVGHGSRTRARWPSL